MKVKALLTTSEITEGKIYNVFNEDYAHYYIISDCNREYGVWKDRFEIMSENEEDGLMSKNNNKPEPIYTKKMIEQMGIEEILFNDEATIVVLDDGRKGVSVVDSTDDPDRLVGIAVAYAYAKGTDGSKTQFKKNMIKINKHNGYKK